VPVEYSEELRKVYRDLHCERKRETDDGHFKNVAERDNSILDLFREATLVLEAFLNPTLHLVCYWRYSLIMHCEHVLEVQYDSDPEYS